MDLQHLYLAFSDKCLARHVKVFMETEYKPTSWLSVKLFISVLISSDMVMVHKFDSR
jgi:hypothetical protein